MDILRDPIWQFIGVVVAILVAAVPVVIWFVRRRSAANEKSQHEAIIAELTRHRLGDFSSAAKHKKSKDDGNLFANISSDFLNQFPVPVGVMAAHLDSPYTPENFGASDWIAVFRRLTMEGYFVTADGSSPKRLKITTPLNAGSKLEHWLQSSAELKSRIADLPLHAGVDFEPIPQNGFIEKEFNGQAIRAFLQGNSLHVEHEIPGGGTSYYIFDENGNAVAPQWPFPLEEYSVEIDPGLILKTTVEPLADGFTKETIEMKWGKRAVLTRNSQNQLAQILVTGSTLLHTEKKILFKAPDFRNKL